MIVLGASPALAQNQGQIGRAKSGASCPGCNLFQADFGGAAMRGRNFAHARLRQADLSLSTMNGANFSGAKLSGANFSGAQLDRARGLSQGQLNAACGDAETDLPAGLRVPACR